MGTVLQDVRFAIRSLRRAPRFVTIVVLTLALGIGANTAIFSVVNRLLLHPLPYANSDRLVYLTLGSHQAQFTMSPPRYIARAWKEEAHSLDGVQAYMTRDLLATGADGARLVHGISMTAGLPAFLGVHAALGRTFAPADARPGAPPVALISYAMWQREYAGAPSALGRTITLDDTPRTVVGVMPPGWDAFAGASDPSDVWVPLSLGAQMDSTGISLGFVQVIARVRADVPVAQVQRELDTLTARAQKTAPGMIYGIDFTTRITPPSGKMADAGVHDALLVLLAAVGLVLLVACANVANLLLARGTSRAREIALRAALGASRWRLVRQLLAESLILALAAGAVGLLVGSWALDALVRLRPESLAALRGVRLDPFVLEFTFALSLVTGVLFGLVPALQATSSTLGHALRGGGSGVVRGGGARSRGALVAGEMALSVVLLVSAGLLVRSVAYLQHVDTGFDAHNLFAVHMSLPRSRYQAPASRELFAQQMLDGIRRTPGVAAATQAFVAPPHYTQISSPLQIEGRASSSATQPTVLMFNNVQPDYFRTVGISLLRGRTFTPAEMRSGNAVIINEAMARHYWPGQQAVGKRFRDLPSAPSDNASWETVVGVVPDVAGQGLTRDMHAPQLYSPYREATVPVFIGAPRSLLFIVRSTSDPAPIIAAIRQVSHSLDRDVAIPEVNLAETQLERSIAGPRFNMALLTAFAVLAVALAAVGLAAVIGYAVTERTHEIGIRMALGAREGSVLGLVVAQGMRAAVIGVALGVVGALAATRLLSTMLYGVEPRDPVTFLGVTALLLLVALAATWIPARRATRVDPMIALRGE